MTSSPRPGLRGGRRIAPPGPADPAAFSRALDDAAAHFQAGRLDAAAQVYRRLERDAPGDIRAPYSLAMIDLRQGRLARARTRLEAVVARQPEHAAALHNLGAVRQQLGDWAGAQAAYAGTLAVQPDSVISRIGLAMALAALGRADEAIEQNRILARDAAQRPAALTRVALIDPAALDDAEVATLRAAAGNERLDDDARIGASFALGEALDQRGDDAGAFAAWDAGNRAQRARLDPAAAGRVHDAAIAYLRQTVTPAWLAARAGQGSPSRAPIFIVGMPRSGSTLIEQVLASHPGVRGLGETGVLPRLVERGYPKAPRELRALADRYLEAMGERGWDGAARFVDKTLENYLHVGLIAAMFPKAVILHAVRDPVDLGFAIWRQLFAQGGETLYGLADIGAEYVRYRGLMDHWAALAPGRIAEVGYEALVTEPEMQIRRLVTGLVGLAWDAAVLAPQARVGAVQTASASQVRRPIHAGSVRRGRRHGARLQPLIEALGPYA